MYDPKLPYNDLPPLPPQAELETKLVLKKAIAANKALAELRGAGHLIPNQAVLIQTLELQEAKLSSEIENIVTTNDELYLAFADHASKIDPQTKEVLSYKDALWHGYKELKEKKRLLTTPLYEELVQVIKGTTEGVRKGPGTKLVNTRGEVQYTPPEGEKVIRECLTNMERFMFAEDSLDPLIKMAVMHYQFEAIHPFTDGNGRTGRILNILYLIDKGLLDIPVLYLSRFIIENKNDYYIGLRKVTEEGAWETWVLFMLEALLQTATVTKERILAIHRLFEKSVEAVRTQLPKIYSKDLVEVIFRSPYCKIRLLEEAAGIGRQTASYYLQELHRIGLVRELKVGRDKYYINDEFLKLLIL